jgi:hypothetical protein
LFKNFSCWNAGWTKLGCHSHSYGSLLSICPLFLRIVDCPHNRILCSIIGHCCFCRSPGYAGCTGTRVFRKYMRLTYPLWVRTCSHSIRCRLRRPGNLVETGLHYCYVEFHHLPGVRCFLVEDSRPLLKNRNSILSRLSGRLYFWC